MPFWGNLQVQFDLAIAQRTARRRIEREVHARQAA
jgi:hypothetical protein